MATLRAIRQAIGFNVPGQQPSAMQLYTTTADSPDAHTIVSALLEGDSGSHRGKYVVVNEPDTERTLSGLLRRVDSFDAETGQLTLVGDLPFTPDEDTDFELWESIHSPQTIHSLINQAIDHANKRTYDPLIATGMYLGPTERHMDVPEDFYYISRVQSLSAVHHRVVGIEGWPDAAPQDTTSLTVRVWNLPQATAVAVEVADVNVSRFTHLGVVAYNYGDADELTLSIDGGPSTAYAVQGKGWKYVSHPIASMADVTELELNVSRVAGGAQAYPLGVRFLMFVDEATAEWEDVKFYVERGLSSVDIILPSTEGSSLYAGLYQTGVLRWPAHPNAGREAPRAADQGPARGDDQRGVRDQRGDGLGLDGARARAAGHGARPALVPARAHVVPRPAGVQALPRALMTTDVTPFVTQQGQIKLGRNFFKLKNMRVRQTKAATLPPKLTLGEYGANDDPYRSNLIYSDHSGGIGLRELRGAGDITKVWWTTLDISHNRHLVLGPLVHKIAPPVASIADASLLIEYDGTVLAAFGTSLRRLNLSSGTWSTMRTLPAVPTDAKAVRLNTVFQYGFDVEHEETDDERHGMFLHGDRIYVGFEPFDEDEDDTDDHYLIRSFSLTGQRDYADDVEIDRSTATRRPALRSTRGWRAQRGPPVHGGARDHQRPSRQGSRSPGRRCTPTSKQASSLTSMHRPQDGRGRSPTRLRRQGTRDEHPRVARGAGHRERNRRAVLPA